MNTFNLSIRKKLKKIHSEAAVKIRDLLKNEKIILIDDRWNLPSNLQFEKCHGSIETYLDDCGIVKHPSALNIDDIIIDACYFSYTTKEEIDKFKKETWPKLYGKWLEAEKKRKAENREANAKNVKKIRAKIAKLQTQLEEVERKAKL